MIHCTTRSTNAAPAEWLKARRSRPSNPFGSRTDLGIRQRRLARPSGPAGPATPFGDRGGAKVHCDCPSLLVIFHQAHDDPAGREQCFLFLFVESGNGLCQPHAFCVAGDLRTATPLAVSSIFTSRPSVGCGFRSTMPRSSSVAMVVPIDCGLMPSDRADRPSSLAPLWRGVPGPCLGQ